MARWVMSMSRELSIVMGVQGASDVTAQGHVAVAVAVAVHVERSRQRQRHLDHQVR